MYYYCEFVRAIHLPRFVAVSASQWSAGECLVDSGLPRPRTSGAGKASQTAER